MKFDIIENKQRIIILIFLLNIFLINMKYNEYIFKLFLKDFFNNINIYLIYLVFLFYKFYLNFIL